MRKNGSLEFVNFFVKIEISSLILRSTMIAVPRPIQKIFDSVPLKAYENEDDAISPEGLYSFSLKSPSTPLILGVYNTFKQGQHILPTDPISLFTLIILAKKNGFGLPDTVSKNASGITRVPFRGSPSNFLPVLINDGSIRTIENWEQIAKTITVNNIESETISIINEFADTVLFDSWISCLLVEELKDETFYQLFAINNALELYEIKQQIPKWNSFSVRHPSLFEPYSSKHLKVFYATQCDAFENAIKRLKVYLNASDQQGSTIKYKVAAYVIIFDHFLKGTQLGMVLNRFPDVITKSYTILES